MDVDLMVDPETGLEYPERPFELSPGDVLGAAFELVKRQLGMMLVVGVV